MEREYGPEGRTGYGTYVRHDADMRWLRLTVALLAERAGVQSGTIKVVAEQDHL